MNVIKAAFFLIVMYFVIKHKTVIDADYGRKYLLHTTCNDKVFGELTNI